MRKLCTKFYIWLMSLPALLASVFGAVVPAYAAIDIQVDGSGVKIQPGDMPDMTQVTGVKDAVDDLVMPQVRAVAQVITTICTVICLAAFLISVTKLATSAGNPQVRQRAGAVRRCVGRRVVLLELPKPRHPLIARSKRAANIPSSFLMSKI